MRTVAWQLPPGLGQGIGRSETTSRKKRRSISTRHTALPRCSSIPLILGKFVTLRFEVGVRSVTVGQSLTVKRFRRHPFQRRRDPLFTGAPMYHHIRSQSSVRPNSLVQNSFPRLLPRKVQFTDMHEPPPFSICCSRYSRSSARSPGRKHRRPSCSQSHPDSSSGNRRCSRSRSASRGRCPWWAG